jgi:hypothetical protein
MDHDEGELLVFVPCFRSEILAMDLASDVSLIQVYGNNDVKYLRPKEPYSTRPSLTRDKQIADS